MRWLEYKLKGHLYGLLHAAYPVLYAQVVLGTNTSIGEMRTVRERMSLSCPVVLLDEAGQATEPSALVPLTQGAEWVLMAGDLKQLRPTVRTDVAQRELGFCEEGGSIYGRCVWVGSVAGWLALSCRRSWPLVTTGPRQDGGCLLRIGP